MKSIFKLIVFFLLVSTSFNSFSQSIPMLGQNIVWTERSVSVADIIEYWPYEIWTDGDTLIDNTLYYKLYRGDFEESNSTSEAYIREDSGKTYVRISEAVINWCGYGSFDTFPIDEDVLLFDSSVDEGDTLRVWTFYNLPDTLNRLLIENIDTLFISGMDRRVLSFYSLDNLVYGEWIEGISMVRGLFGPWCEDDEAYNELLCYSVNYVTIYPEGASCIVGIKEYNLNNQISIVPNPSNRYITIQNENDTNSRYEITIYDLNGRKFIRQENLNLDSRIDISELTFGMYFIHIQFEDGGRAVKKFVRE